VPNFVQDFDQHRTSRCASVGRAGEARPDQAVHVRDDAEPDFEEGGAITWKGEWKGKAYEDKGTILKVEPRRRLQYSHCSPLSGVPDTPGNRHTVTIALPAARGQTRVDLSQDNNASEESREHSEKNWRGVLEGLKRLLESTAPGARTLMV